MGIDLNSLDKNSVLYQKVTAKLNDRQSKPKSEKPKDMRNPNHILKHTNEFFNLKKTFKVTPVSKPRMTKQDKWRTDPLHPNPKKRQRKCVTKYWEYKRCIRSQMHDFEMPVCNVWIIFYMPMYQKSWSEKKKKEYNMTIHMLKPDKDNLEKGLTDALFSEDKQLADSRISKIWCHNGDQRIEVYF